MFQAESNAATSGRMSVGAAPFAVSAPVVWAAASAPTGRIRARRKATSLRRRGLEEGILPIVTRPPFVLSLSKDELSDGSRQCLHDIGMQVPVCAHRVTAVDARTSLPVGKTAAALLEN